MDCKSFTDLSIRVIHIDKDDKIEDDLLNEFSEHLISCDKCADIYHVFDTIHSAFEDFAEQIFCKGFSEDIMSKAFEVIFNKAKEYEEAGDIEQANECYADALKIMPDNPERILMVSFTLGEKTVYINLKAEKIEQPLGNIDFSEIYLNGKKKCEVDFTGIESGLMMDSDDGYDNISKIYEDDHIIIETKQNMDGNFLIITPKKRS